MKPLLFLTIVVTAIQARTLEVIKRLPHKGYSEGLAYHQGYLWHAVPKKIFKIDPNTGETLASFQPATDYSESLTWFKNRLWNVSYSNNGFYAGTLLNGQFKFERRGKVAEARAWGLTHNGKHLITTGTHGSNKLYFYDPKSLKLLRTISTKVKDLEDLAWDGEFLWSSSFTAYRGQIFRIDAKSGTIEEFFSLPDPEACPIIDGIAYHQNKLYITGKQCPSIWVVKKPTFRAITSKPIKRPPYKPPLKQLRDTIVGK